MGRVKGEFRHALKLGKPAARQALKNATPFVSSECPLAAMHIALGMEIEAGSETLPYPPTHSIELFARAYGIAGAWSDEKTRRG